MGKVLAFFDFLILFSRLDFSPPWNRAIRKGKSFAQDVIGQLGNQTRLQGSGRIPRSSISTSVTDTVKTAGQSVIVLAMFLQAASYRAGDFILSSNSSNQGRVIFCFETPKVREKLNTTSNSRSLRNLLSHVSESSLA